MLDAGSGEADYTQRSAGASLHQRVVIIWRVNLFNCRVYHGQDRSVYSGCIIMKALRNNNRIGPSFDIPRSSSVRLASMSAWGLGGDDDQLGTVNLLTDEVVKDTMRREIRLGRLVRIAEQRAQKADERTGRSTFQPLHTYDEWTSALIIFCG